MAQCKDYFLRVVQSKKYHCERSPSPEIPTSHHKNSHCHLGWLGLKSSHQIPVHTLLRHPKLAILTVVWTTVLNRGLTLETPGERL